MPKYDFNKVTLKSVLKICSKFTEHPCRSLISIKLQNNFIEIALRYGCPHVNLLDIFRKSFPKNNSGGLLLKVVESNLNKLLNLIEIVLTCSENVEYSPKFSCNGFPIMFFTGSLII